MKSFFKSIFSLLLVCLTLGVTFAATVAKPLSVSSVKVTDDKHIRVTFSEPIDPESVVLKITKQSDNSTIKLDAIGAIADNKEAVDITLDDSLVEASSYTLTIIAGIGISGATITDGASALQDFITPSPLKVFGEVALNAPTNTSAILSEPAKTPPKATTTVSTPPKTEATVAVKNTSPTPTEELPLTGPNTLFFLLASIPLAYFFLKRKSI